VRQGGLAQPGRAEEQHVVERPRRGAARRSMKISQLLADALLADVVVQAARPQGALDHLLVARPARR
jgi:hypothetical protein